MKRINLSINMMMNQGHLHILAVLFALLPTKVLTSQAVADSLTDKASTIVIDPWDDIAEVEHLATSTGEMKAIATFQKVNVSDTYLNIPNNSYVCFKPIISTTNFYVRYHSNDVIMGKQYRIQIIFAPDTNGEDNKPCLVSIRTGSMKDSVELARRLVVSGTRKTIFEPENKIIISQGDRFDLYIGTSVSNAQLRSNLYSRILRIAEILLIPDEDIITFENDGVFYNLVQASRTAWVKSNPNKYEGDVVIPESLAYEGTKFYVSSISSHAFENCNGLTSLSIPTSVTTIGDRAFAGCEHLTVVKVGNPTPVGITQDVFTNRANAKLYVPIGSKVAYEAAEGWKDFKEIIEYEEGDREYNIVLVDPVVRSLCVANWDTNGDGELSMKETANVSDLGTVFKGNSSIKTLNELQYFQGLTSINDNAFDGCSSLTSVTIPNSVTAIGGDAFAGCSGLTSINIPNSVTAIGGDAFYGCSGLTSINIPNSVTDIGDKAFGYCSGLTSIMVEEGNPVYDSRYNCNAIIMTETNELISGCKNTVIPEYLESIGDNAFYGCSGLTSITIPNSVSTIGEWAFFGCSVLTSINIPSVSFIGEGAFCSCSGLTSFTIPKSVTTIGESTFEDCSGLTSITIPNSVKSIESCAFRYCSGLTSINIPNSVTSIGNDAFYECSGLTSINIPNSVTTIRELTFWGCSGLTSIKIPNSVTSIEYDAFGYCSGLTSIMVEEGNPIYDSRNNCNAIIMTETNELIAGCKNTVIPENVESIGDDAFDGCRDLTSITIPNSVTTIGRRAFYGCSGLTSINIPNSVKSIEYETFYACYSLTSIVIPSSVMRINDNAFYSCSNLTAVKMEHTTPLDIKEGGTLFPSKNIFSNRDNATLYVPKGCKAAYEASEFWSKFKEIVEYDESTDPMDIDSIDYNTGEAFDVYDMSGSRVRRQTTTLNDLPKGVYIIGGRKQVVR